MTKDPDESAEERVHCDWCKRDLPLLDPFTLRPMRRCDEGSALLVHDDVYHPDDMRTRPS